MILTETQPGSNITFPVVSVEQMIVHAYNTNTNELWVKPIDGDPREAIILSPTPTSEQGAGFFIDPKPGTTCAVLRVGTIKNNAPSWRQHYVLGFYTLYNSTGSRGGVMENVKSAQGDSTWHGLGSTFIRQTKLGTISLFTNLWSRLEIQQITQTLQGFLRNIILRMRGGKVKWTTATDYSTKLHVEVHDRYESDINSDITGGTSPDYANKVIMDAGKLNDGNLIDIETRQDTDGDNVADEFTKLRIGRPSGGALQQSTLSTNTGTQSFDRQLLVNDEIAIQKTYTHGDNAASRSNIVDTKAGQEDIVSFDDETVTSSTGRGFDDKPLIKCQALDKNSNAVLQEVLIDDNTMYKININDGKAILNIDKDGNVTITSATGTILSGGTGKEQQLLTASYHNLVFLPHFHIATSLGSPTTTAFPIVNALPMDAPTNIFTYTTKAE